MISPDKVIVTSLNATTARVMTGGSVGGLGTPQQNSLPQLTATAYLDGVALDPQPSFKWYSSNPCVCFVDQSGNCTRVSNPNAPSFNSNGGNSTDQLGGLSQIRAVALRPDGSESGFFGVVTVAIQGHGFRQVPGNGSPLGRIPVPSGSLNAPNGFSLVGDLQPPPDRS
jgi:hypothetical protein